MLIVFVILLCFILFGPRKTNAIRSKDIERDFAVSSNSYYISGTYIGILYKMQLDGMGMKRNILMFFYDKDKCSVIGNDSNQDIHLVLAKELELLG